MNEKYQLIKEGDRVLDLGSAPGGWTQVLVGLAPKKVVSLDLLEMKKVQGSTFLQRDILDPETPNRI